MTNKLIICVVSALILLTACGGTRHEGDGSHEWQVFTVPEIGTTVGLGGVEWRVLDVRGGEALLITDRIAGRRAFCDGETTWETSDIRKWLNGEWLKTLMSRMTDAQKDRIMDTEVRNDNNPWYGTDAGNDTVDKIFLLSFDEVIWYFGNTAMVASKEVSETGIYQDRNNFSRMAWDTDNAVTWWLRTPGDSSRNFVRVYAGGSIHVRGGSVRYVRNAVRPAMWFDFSMGEVEKINEKGE
jgi:hypothetical protein